MVEFGKQAFMCGSVECLEQVQYYDMSYLVSIVVCGEDVLESHQLLGFTAKSTEETMWKWSE